MDLVLLRAGKGDYLIQHHSALYFNEKTVHSQSCDSHDSLWRVLRASGDFRDGSGNGLKLGGLSGVDRASHHIGPSGTDLVERHLDVLHGGQRLLMKVACSDDAEVRGQCRLTGQEYQPGSGCNGYVAESGCGMEDGGIDQFA